MAFLFDGKAELERNIKIVKLLTILISIRRLLEMEKKVNRENFNVSQFCFSRNHLWNFYEHISHWDEYGLHYSWNISDSSWDTDICNRSPETIRRNWIVESILWTNRYKTILGSSAILLFNHLNSCDFVQIVGSKIRGDLCLCGCNSLWTDCIKKEPVSTWLI